MPFDGSGNFQRVMNWVADAAAAIKIRADRHDQEDDNFAAGLSMCLTKDGQTQPTANITLNGKKITNLAAPTVNTDAVNKAYVDAIRSFNSTVTMTGNDANGRIYFRGTGNLGLSFEQADLSFGVKQAGNGAGTVDRFVWLPSFGYSGSPLMELKRGGQLNFSTNAMFQVADRTIWTLSDAWGLLQAPSLYINGRDAADAVYQVIFRDHENITRARVGYNRADGRTILDNRSGTGAILNSLELGSAGLYLGSGDLILPAPASNIKLGNSDVIKIADAIGVLVNYPRLRVQSGSGDTNSGITLQDAAGIVRAFLQADYANSRLTLDYRASTGALQQSVTVDASDGMRVTQGSNAGIVLTTGNYPSTLNYQSTDANNTNYPITECIIINRTVNTARSAAVSPCLSTASTGLFEQLGAPNAGTPLAGQWRARGRLATFEFMARRVS